MAANDWLQQLLGQNQDGLSNLLRAAGTGGTPAPDDGSMPVTAAAPTAAAAPEQSGPVAELLNAYALYKKNSGMRQDPLLARGGQVQKNPMVPGTPDPLGGAGAVAFRNQSAGSPRSGMLGQTVKLGETVLHLYYDPKTGKRQVVRVSGPPVGRGVPSVSAAGSRAQPTTGR